MRLVAVVLLLTVFTLAAAAQTNTDTTILYIHNKPASFNARFLQFGMVLLGMKHDGERQFKKGKYNHIPARIPGSLKRKYEMTVTEFQGRKVWTFKPRKNATDKVILYLHGGSYIANILSFHWDLIEELLDKTNATVVVPDYPLAPDAQCPQVLAFTADLYKQLLTKINAENITIMGDSAGGGLSLSLAQEIKEQLLPQPGNIVLLSPWLDVSMANPDIAAIDKTDKMLSIDALKLTGKAYAGSLSNIDRRVSPIYGSFEGLGKISVFIGTHDILLADTRKLKTILEEKGIPFNYFEYPGMFHVWMAVTFLKESKHTVDEIVNLLKQ